MSIIRKWILNEGTKNRGPGSRHHELYEGIWFGTRFLLPAFMAAMAAIVLFHLTGSVAIGMLPTIPLTAYLVYADKVCCGW